MGNSWLNFSTEFIVQSDTFILRVPHVSVETSFARVGFTGTCVMQLLTTCTNLKAFGAPFYPDRCPTYAPGWLGGLDRNARKCQTQLGGDPEINPTPYTAKLVSDGHGRYGRM
jgi:hypothetical protein